jgi:LPS sulfotransferase NodH
VLNAVLGPTVKGREDPAGTWEKAIAKVENEAGIQDRALADSLYRVFASIVEEPRLTPLGFAFSLGMVRDKYANRLRVKALLAERPEIADEQIVDPVFVLGLPRTATTLAHKVLAASPAHRGPRAWEMSHTGLEDPDVARREIKRFDQSIKIATSFFMPGLKHIHPVRAEDPEESLVLMPHGTYWPLFHGSMPSYREWYAARSEAELAGDYECLKQGLQVLQHGRAPKRWIVKYPAHLNDMATIKKVFPDATFVWTHRDPTSVVGSLCSLVTTLWALHQTDPDPLEIGRLVMESMVTSVEEGLEARLGLPPSSIVDVPYHTLSADPYTEVPRLYEAIGATWTESDAAQLGKVLARPRGSRPHTYDMTRYGLQKEVVQEAFAPYLRLLNSFDRLDVEPAAEL